MSDRTFGEIIDRLKKRLEQPLPGEMAQKLMTASHRGDTDFNFNFGQEPVESSVLIMLYNKNDELFFPLIKRAQYGGVHSGQIGLPGGKTEKADKNRIATALRETEEEIGIEAARVEVIGPLSELYVQASNFNVKPILGFLSSSPQFKRDPKEVSEIIECRLDRLMEKDIIKEKELLIRGKYLIRTPYFDINNYVVWGATAMILSEFVEIIREIYQKH